MESSQFDKVSNEPKSSSAIEYELVDVTLGDETRMPLPERTYTQELLDIPIPLENRLAHLIPFIEPIAGVHTQYAIANKTGANPDWVVRTAEQIGITSVSEGIDDEDRLRRYASPALELLQEEWDWYQAYKELDDQLTETAVARFIAKSPQWVRKNAHELEVYLNEDSVVAGRVRLTYKKTIIPQLRHLLLIFPPAEDWCTKQDLIELSGKGWPWIDKQLKKVGIVVQTRRSELSGSVNELIAPEAREYLTEIKAGLPDPAGNNLTIEGISVKIGRSAHWVIPRMPLGYESMGKYKIDDKGRVGLHYPPKIWQQLELLSRSEEADSRLALSALAKRIDKSPQWTESRIPYTSFVVEETGYRSPVRFDDGLVDELKAIIEEENSDTRLSVSEIANIIGHTAHWVRGRLPYTTISPEEKRGKNYEVYKQEVVEQLRALPGDIITYGPKLKRQ